MNSISLKHKAKKASFKVACLMINLGREADSNNEICLGLRFFPCAYICKALRLVRIEHCFWDGGRPLSSSFDITNY